MQDPFDRAGALFALFQTAVASADPASCVPPLLPAQPAGKTVIVAAGKAAASMARAAERHWQGPLTGIAITRYAHVVPCEHIEVIEAGHPVPDENGREAAARLLESVRGLTPDDLVLALFSGGGSALLALPAPGISLADKQHIHRQLLASGAPIRAMNTVRKHLSAIKGGRLAEAAYPARLMTLLISDVPGDDPSTIASGPTIGDATTLQDALEIIRRYQIEAPDHVLAHLRDPLSETPKPDSPCFRSAGIRLAARPAEMVAAVEREAWRLGFSVISLGAEIEGEAREIGAGHARLALEIVEQKREDSSAPVLIVSGGETTVTLGNRTGRGGRNLEYLLSLALAVEGNRRIHALACDTDGLDGSEDNAGALLDPETLRRARASGVDPALALEQNDSYGVFAAAGSLVITGPTRTNVNDIRLIRID